MRIKIAALKSASVRLRLGHHYTASTKQPGQIGQLLHTTQRAKDCERLEHQAVIGLSVGLLLKRQPPGRDA